MDHPYPPIEKAQRERRFKRIYIDPVILGAVFEEGNKVEICQNGLPRTSKIIGADFDIPRKQFVLFVEDESYPVVEIGQECESLPGTLFKIERTENL